MSGLSILRTGLIASIGVAGLTLSACATYPESSDTSYGSSEASETSTDCVDAACDAVVESSYGEESTEDVVTETAPEPVYLVEETPLIEESPIVEETLIVEESPIVEETPIVAETYVIEETPIMEQAPVVEYVAPVMSLTCPDGTVDNGDGTCMVTEVSTSYTTDTVAAPYVPAAPVAAECPVGSVRTETGDCSVTTGYAPAPTYTAPKTYLPVRK